MFLAPSLPFAGVVTHMLSCETCRHSPQSWHMCTQQVSLFSCGALEHSDGSTHRDSCGTHTCFHWGALSLTTVLTSFILAGGSTLQLSSCIPDSAGDQTLLLIRDLKSCFRTKSIRKSFYRKLRVQFLLFYL